MVGGLGPGTTALLTGKTNYKNREEAGTWLGPANRPERCAHRGGLGGISAGERQKKAERMGTERWPRVYLPRQAWQRAAALRGGARPF